MDLDYKKEYRYSLNRHNALPDLTLRRETENNGYVYECNANVPENCLVVAVNIQGYYFDVHLMVLKPIPSIGPGHRFLVRRIVSPILFSDRDFFPWPVQADDFLNEVIRKAKELGETQAEQHRLENPKPVYKSRYRT